MEPHVSAILFWTALILFSIMTSWAIRRTPSRTMDLAGGILVGILLGPTVAGRLVPREWEGWAIGGIEQREGLDALIREEEALDAARAHLLVPGGASAVVDGHPGITVQRVAAQDALENARWQHRRPFRLLTWACAVAVLLAAGCSSSRAGSRDEWLHAMNIGIPAALVPGALGVLVARLFSLNWPEALLAGACLAIGPWRRHGADQSEAALAEEGGNARMGRAGMVMSILGTITVGIVLGGIHAWQSMPALLVFLALPIGTIPSLRSMIPVRVIRGIALPILGAIAILHIELIGDARPGLIVLVALLSGDGRWFGGVIGAVAGGGRGLLQSLRMVAGVMACGPTQLAATAALSATGLLPPALVLSLLCGVMLVMGTEPIRHRTIRSLREMEESVQDRHR